MLKIRYWLRVFWLFLNRFKRLLFVGCFAGLVAFLLLSQFPGLFNFLLRREVIGVVGRYGIEDLPINIQSEISLGLTKIDTDGSALPSLAVSWEAQDEGKTWIFKLGDFKWQDGTRVTARDISYKFNDVSLEVVDNQTIKFSLKDPFSPFPTVVSRPVFKRGLLGTGEWKVIKVTNVANGNFIESLKLVSTLDGSKNREYRFYPTEDAARIALKLSEVSQINDIVEPRDFKNWNSLNITPDIREDLYVGVFINNQDTIFSDKSARQALAYAIDKDKFEGKRAISPISPFSWAYNSQAKQYNYNLSRAKELLGALPKEQRANLNIELTTTSNLLPIAEKIKGFWEALGISTKVLATNSQTRNFQALLAIQAIPNDPDQYIFWHSTQENSNITNYKNSKESQRIDKLLEDGRRTLDQEERKKIYLDFQRFLVEDSPAIFLYHPVTYTISKK